MQREIEGPWKLLIREIAFRTVCTHRQGLKPNIFLYCMPRSGSTWLLNTIAAHPGCRFVGRPFMSLKKSRWRRRLPELADPAGRGGGRDCWNYIHFEGEALQRFERVARHVADGDWAIYPTIRWWAPYFHRRTDRVVFQIHSLMPMIEWCHEHLAIQTVILLRHPIPNALSNLQRGWRDEAEDFLTHDWFRRTQLDRAQRSYCDRVLAHGSPLDRHVLDWCLRWLIPMRALESGAHKDWLVLTYEQTVMEPERVVDLLSERLDLPDRDAMRSQLRRPSSTVTPDTAPRIGDASYLISRWRQKVSAQEVSRAMESARVLGLDAYREDDELPSEQLWHGTPSFVPAPVRITPPLRASA